MSVIYGEYLVDVHFSNILHSFILHFTLHSTEKICIEFSANYPLTTFRIPQNTPSHRPSVCRLSSVCRSVACNVRTPYSGGCIFPLFLRHLVPWPSVDTHRKFYGDHPRGTPPAGELCRVPECSEVRISEFVFPSSERSSEVGSRNSEIY